MLSITTPFVTNVKKCVYLVAYFVVLIILFDSDPVIWIILFDSDPIVWLPSALLSASVEAAQRELISLSAPFHTPEWGQPAFCLC